LVSHVLDGCGNGNWNLLSFDLPVQTRKILQGTPLNRYASGIDAIGWAYSSNGDFSLNSAYSLAKALNPLNPPTDNFNWIWKVAAFPKIQMFLWLCVNNGIPVKEVLGSRGLNIEQKCSICKRENESIIHVLRDCSFAVSFWIRTSIPDSVISSFILPLWDWMHKNCLAKETTNHKGVPWKFLFLAGIWSLWLHRNNIISKGKLLTVNSKSSAFSKLWNSFFS
jgi:hypothetical protein